MESKENTETRHHNLGLNIATGISVLGIVLVSCNQNFSYERCSLDVLLALIPIYRIIDLFFSPPSGGISDFNRP